MGARAREATEFIQPSDATAGIYMPVAYDTQDHSSCIHVWVSKQQGAGGVPRNKQDGKPR